VGQAAVRGSGCGACRDRRRYHIYGQLMDSVYLYDRWYGHIPSAGWDEVASQAGWVCDHWDQPDEGIWETRGGPKKFLYSQLMCWVAIERAIRLITDPEDVRPVRRQRRRRRGRSANAAGQVHLTG
jgi:GH15 family glucan-1,4-alpha-glucosidase